MYTGGLENKMADVGKALNAIAKAITEHGNSPTYNVIINVTEVDDAAAIAARVQAALSHVEQR